MKEVWKPIPGYEGLYKASDCGRIKSLPRTTFGVERVKSERIISQQKDKLGYCSVKLSKNGIVTRHRVHRLVALAFIPNPEKLPFINHKDENPSNNCVGNLEWCNQKYNVNYGNSLIKMRQAAITSEGRPICCYDLQGNLVKEYSCFNDAVKDGFKRRHIENCINGKEKTHKGLRWFDKHTRLRANKPIPVVGVPIDGGLPVKFDSIRLSRLGGFCSRNVYECINGRKKSHKGYRWYRQDKLQTL